MGSCISKCKPNKKKPVQDEEDHLNLQQIKPMIVVVETENNPPLKSPIPHLKTLNPNLPLSPISSCSSSSFSCTTNSHNSSSSSSSSSSTSSSSILPPKHKPFKQNPQITTSAPPHKRQRAISPNLTRQKSFRRDPLAGPTFPNHHFNKNSPLLRSSSPSRRFVTHKEAMDSVKANSGVGKVETFNGSSDPNKPSLRSPSPSRRFVSHKEAMDSVKANSGVSRAKTFNGLSDPNSRSRRSFRFPSMRKEAEICRLNRVVSKVNGINIGEERSLKCVQDVEMLPVEDLSNPHIALDCFIFL